MIFSFNLPALLRDPADLRLLPVPASLAQCQGQARPRVVTRPVVSGFNVTWLRELGCDVDN